MTMLRRVRLSSVLLLGISGAVSPIPALAQSLPTRPGTCVATTVSSIGTRLVDGRTGRPIHGSGSSVRFANGGVQVSYDDVDAIRRSRVGDQVFFCLISIPQDCPPGDPRGRVYTTTNRRTLESWTLPDAQHMCGGA
ncbi:hypothetical protein [Falsiroseomonas sp. CW058]|uniref:hypothetical protein n=1 Tax=Falsiroseomonas sp. CW058 TaxID=3388664 RepID=UPI003D3215A3